ncbi:5-formyltetrahydrofolate cyclo-ligase-like [Rhagoletis pomonella]|uniref:5-formyltetrahydrofolate cyclo-ligase-like n=1 Tax=Rhagoletis pomonella TaxID=28610 RepID=UPI001784A352|nr:5-formyltetrahydrofolate cyclo-ligase-like [Rhagoletis pomonella]XP_036331691.1 5-formyltetrahydrofolate cyclo-ligase-like [Rhagoletis pomonella]
MATTVRNPLKKVLRQRMKIEVIPSISAESIARQSRAIYEKVIASEAFRQAKDVSIYLSTGSEVDTLPLLRELFNQQKNVFVPTYSGKLMEMVRVKDWADYEALPLTKWNIKQPSEKEGRENSLTNGRGIDLFLMPGVAFTLSGGRMGHGMGYYDSFLHRHFNIYPEKKPVLMALAFREQIVDESTLPLDPHDVRLTTVITE